MTAKKSTAKSVDRRKHYSTDKLPTELRATIKQMLIDCKWPNDFGNHYDGSPRFCDVVQYCKAKGYTITKSAVGRFALRIQKDSVEEIKGDMKFYVLSRLSETCQEFANLQSDIIEIKLHPERMQPVGVPLSELELLVEQDIADIEKILADLKRLK